jgi:predicted AlkP superfamily phosphohydrolase/phosphomutase
MLLNHPKVLFIGLDSLERDLIFELGRGGALPHLMSLIEASAWCECESFPGLGSDAMWASFSTGVTPTRHGRYFNRDLAGGGYCVDSYEPSPTRPPPFWEALASAGNRVAVIDMPYTELSRDLNGLQLSDWLVHDRKHRQALSWPPELASEVVEKFGADRLGQRDQHGRDMAAFREMRRELIGRTEAKARLACEVLERESWDFFAVAFHDGHDAGHTFWHFHDPTHPDYDNVTAREMGNPISDVYAAIDEAVGRVLEYVGPDTKLFVWAGPGMGPNYSGNHVLDDILRMLEAGPAMRMRPVDIARGAFRMLPPSLRNFFKDSAAATDEVMLQADRSRRKCFALPHNEVSGAIRVNLVGREPKGKGRPGDEFKAFCDQLAADLQELVNVETGKPLIAEIVRTSESYPGPLRDNFPDMFVVWPKDGPIRTVASPKFGTRSWTYPGSRSGDHSFRCLMMTRGPGIEPGKLNDSYSILDVPATIASVLSVAMPDLDGKIMTQWSLSMGAESD